MAYVPHDAPDRIPLASELLAAYREVRRATEALCEGLHPEDYVVQSMPEASPVKWHLGHTTWFFETLVLSPIVRGYEPHDARYNYLFNSYYEALGPRIERPWRGLLTRPTVAEVMRYREAVDAALERALPPMPQDVLAAIVPTVVLGLHHEQQHQELLLTDLKHAFSFNPLRPALREPRPSTGRAPAMHWKSFPEGLHSIGTSGPGFSFDNERPRHRVFVEAFALGSRLATNREYLDFIDDHGYRRPELWLSDGWDALRRGGWQAPLYWEASDGVWRAFTLGGMQPLELDAPVTHLSLFEADAYARWAGARLPTEAEWEIAAATEPVEGNFVESGRLQPAPAAERAGLAQLYGDAWEWTSSAYLPYPGFRPEPGIAREYNGKFMSGQMVLRGGSCASPRSHLRASYRNFFYPGARWQFSGVRLARDA